MHFVDRQEKTVNAKTSAFSEFNAKTDDQEFARKLAGTQPASAKVLKGFKKLRRAIAELLDGMRERFKEQDNVLEVLTNCQAITEILTGLRVLHNGILGAEYVKSVGKKNGIAEQLEALRLPEVVDININLSRLFNTNLTMVRSQSSSEIDLASGYLHPTAQAHIVDRSTPHFHQTSARGEPRVSPPQARPSNKFGTISQLFHRKLITTAEKTRLKCLLIQEDPHVTRVLDSFAADNNIVLLRARIQKILKNG